MSAKPAPAAPQSAVAAYEAMIDATPGAERKGATLPYTSLNGNMYSTLHKDGRVTLRLSKPDFAAFIGEFGGGPFVHESGAVMKDYVALPDRLLADPRVAAGWLGKSLAYARTLRPKATTRKKSDA